MSATGALRRSAEAASQNAVALGYVSGWRLVRLLPERAALATFTRAADQIYRRDGRSVRRLRANLARVRPDLDEVALERLTHAAVRSYLRYWAESFRLPSWPTDDLVRRTRVVNEAVVRDALARGTGAVAPVPHMANWDWAGAWACATGIPLTTVAERLKPERLYDEFVAYRASLGMEILPAGDPGTFGTLIERVRQNRLVPLLADRDMSRSGVEVTLCGERARMPRGPAELARRTGAPLIPATLYYDGPELVVTFHDPVPVAEGEAGTIAAMQAVADLFTEALREHPVDWHMMQRVFVADLPAGRNGNGTADGNGS
ncbi:MAG TPA: phosphatidylinositol mannoside acyltransferase [Nocardioidaceae bacterium]|nr:phosphatidylinositol mannoside acyltransferase [Nocardioidaceae bacterium]